jgi:lysophospholipase L1-like esterase
VNRVGTAFLIALTVIVLGGVVYTLGHNTRVPEAGQTPGYTLPAEPTEPVGATNFTTSSEPTPSVTATASSSSSSTAASSAASISSGVDETAPLVAFLGDDYTHGVGGSGGAATFPALVAATLHVRQQSFYLDNAGYAKTSSSGKTYADLVAQVIAARPDVVVVTGGRNDRADDPGTLASGATALFAALHAGLPNAEIIAVSPWWGDSAHPAVLQSLGTAVQHGVTAVGGNYLNLSDPLFGHPEWMANAADPNDLGYQAIAASLEPNIEGLLH